MRSLVLIMLGVVFSSVAQAQNEQDDADAANRASYIREHYAKFEYEIPMRDGRTLFTSVYRPYDDSEDYPILMLRTPYSVAPYGVDEYRETLGPSAAFEEEGFIFVFQDVRGRFRSEGDFVNMRPQIGQQQGHVDDATDAYDTIEWLVENLEGNNGRVGQWGISYPGYYTSVSTINAHPALRAVSPQAPIADWFFDDFHRNGAFVPSMAFIFFDRFDNFPEGKNTLWPEETKRTTHDGYQFFLDLGPLKNVNEQWFHGERPFWNELAAHPNYDAYWQARNILPHLDDTRPAALVVGGWYDTEDLYGPLRTYSVMSRNNEKDDVHLVMGPWYHGQWMRDGSTLGEAEFGFDTAAWFRERLLLPFFLHHLKDDEAELPRASVFETGANRWRRFDRWPPRGTQERVLYFGPGNTLSDRPPQEARVSYISDPANPVPHSPAIGPGWDREYMVADQRFAARRPDVLVFQTEPLEEDLTLAGNLDVSLRFATDQSAADLVVKLVDVFPPRDENSRDLDEKRGNRHELVRWGAIRGRFRDGMEQAKPFVPNEEDEVAFELYDVLHTFKRGHRLQLQVQSSLFPFLDRNPQHFVDNIFEAEEGDFVRAMHSLRLGNADGSQVRFSVLPGAQ
jgi:putative CocE/NonD family hydrolase